ncbi:hypothetical protein M2G47_02125 [Vibrio vulnificus]|nr:hypothetical protein [Vibrio vulnificus]
MKNEELEQYLSQAEQPVKDFMAEVLETLGKKITKEEEPLINLQYFGANIEIKLTSFEGVYELERSHFNM